MKPLGLNEIREKYLAFFQTKNHLRMNSFSLVPHNDNSLLLINSGMAPLKPYFTGQETPPNKRATTCQKCIRTGDIENVGKTVRHGTFFEMLGNFSFGDYFKIEAITWAWEFITKELDIPTDRLYASVYLDDDEAYGIWQNTIGLPPERIFRMGKEDNFWEVGLGPCGPCSEIYYDKGEKYGCGQPGCTVGCDCDRYMEFWNLVFTQFNKQEDGSYTNLPNPNIDTGMGLERLAAMMQDVDSIFDIDTLVAIRDKVCAIAGVTYHADPKKDVSIRVITDHVRAITFMTADGILPANDGRGYVLKRLLRRAARHGKLLGIDRPFLAEVCQVAVAVSQHAYPELKEKQAYIDKLVSIEEARFYETLDQGLEILKGYVQKLKAAGETVLGGPESFKMYDTFGFPVDLMIEILAEDGLTIDEDAFKQEMKAQQNRARSAREESTFMGAKETVYSQIQSDKTTAFIGYEQNRVEGAEIIALVVNGQLADTAKAGEQVAVLLDKTPFYAESGGQVGDKGTISVNGNVVTVTDCVKVVGGRFAHLGTVQTGSLSVGQKVTASIDMPLRRATAANHSATHLLHQALRTILGSHVEQAGSYVTGDKLRFDFTHFGAVTKEELQQAEQMVNEQIMAALPVDVANRPLEEARKMGAAALFGEKYGDIVRVVAMGDYSLELCGGTHVSNTAQIGTFKIVSEGSAASGVRRIEALTGLGALAHYRRNEETLQQLCALFKTAPDKLLTQAQQHLQDAKDMAKALEQARGKMAGSLVETLMNDKADVKGVTMVTAKVEGMATEALRDLGDKVKDKLQSGVVALVGMNDGKATMLVMVTEDVVKQGVNAGAIIKEAVTAIGGKGGGKPTMAMAGGKDAAGADEALKLARKAVENMLA